jgi:hypothetical protein
MKVTQRKGVIVHSVLALFMIGFFRALPFPSQQTRPFPQILQLLASEAKISAMPDLGCRLECIS